MPAVPQMNWHQQRVVWNQEGKCAREACKAPLINPRKPDLIHVHRDSQLKYCASCARRINEANNQELVVAESTRVH
jgi:hypothetical protein